MSTIQVTRKATIWLSVSDEIRRPIETAAAL